MLFMELIILIGLQASGKSAFRRAHFAKTHLCISKDDFPKAKKRNLRQNRMLEEAFRQGLSVIVDNTNPSIEERAELIALARTFQTKVTGYYFESLVADCLKRNSKRQDAARVPDVAIFSTIKKLQRPAYNEGFDKLFFVRLRDDLNFEINDWIEDGQ
jgi:predicted kinase